MTNVVALSNIAALRAFSSAGSSSPLVWVEGYGTVADGGEGMFAYVSTVTNTSSDNGGTIIVATVGSVYYQYVREYNKQPLNILWFGVLITSPPDYSPALIGALKALPSGGQIFFPPGKFPVLCSKDH
jgi:hypothetical protein